MSTEKQKQNLAAKVGSSAVERFASTLARLWGAGNAVKGQDERQHRAPLTAFPARCPRLPFFILDTGRCRHSRDDES